MPHLIWSPASKLDLDRIYTHYATRNREAALRAILTIDAGVDLISAFPNSGRLTDPPLRLLSIDFGRGSFIVLYDPSADPVTILRIRHSRELSWTSEISPE